MSVNSNILSCMLEKTVIREFGREHETSRLL